MHGEALAVTDAPVTSAALWLGGGLAVLRQVDAKQADPPKYSKLQRDSRCNVARDGQY